MHTLMRLVLTWRLSNVVDFSNAIWKTVQLNLCACVCVHVCVRQYLRWSWAEGWRSSVVCGRWQDGLWSGAPVQRKTNRLLHSQLEVGQSSPARTFTQVERNKSERVDSKIVRVNKYSLFSGYKTSGNNQHNESKYVTLLTWRSH